VDTFAEDHLDTLLKYARADIEPNFLADLGQEDLMDLSERVQKYAGRNPSTPTALGYIAKHLTGTPHDHDQSSHGRGPVPNKDTRDSINNITDKPPAMGGRAAGPSVNNQSNNRGGVARDPGKGSGQIGVPSGNAMTSNEVDRPEKSTAWDGRHDMRPMPSGQGESPNSFTDRLKVTIGSIGKVAYEPGWSGIPAEVPSTNSFTDKPIYDKQGNIGSDGGSVNNISNNRLFRGATSEGESPNSFTDSPQGAGPDNNLKNPRDHADLERPEKSLDYKVVFGTVGTPTRAPRGSM
jgi:hypothetical protein